jgi:hypothetical protein
MLTEPIRGMASKLLSGGSVLSHRVAPGGDVAAFDPDRAAVPASRRFVPLAPEHRRLNEPVQDSVRAQGGAVIHPVAVAGCVHRLGGGDARHRSRRGLQADLAEHHRPSGSSSARSPTRWRCCVRSTTSPTRSRAFRCSSATASSSSRCRARSLSPSHRPGAPGLGADRSGGRFDARRAGAPTAGGASRRRRRAGDRLTRVRQRQPPRPRAPGGHRRRDELPARARADDG